MIEAPARPASVLPAPGPDERIRHRIRLAAFCMLLMVLPFVTAPGRIIADTKLDLAVNPGPFLARALTLWDPHQFFGLLQNQAVGYLFPMGPFFLLGKLAALQPWVIQRLWIGAIAVTAFLGVVRLAGRLGIGTPWARIAAGLAYAASPAGLPMLGALSEEFLPAAMLPWILLPLVDAGRGGRRGIAVARSAAAVGLCGAVNATATIAVLIPPLVYILTLRRPAPRWRIFAWWLPAVAAATFWWSVPLVLLFRYGVSWLPYTESAAVTTSVTSLSQILRGAENWVSYLVVNGQPWWQLGYRLVTGPIPILLSGLAAGLGLTGLMRARLPERRFLTWLLLTGVVIIAAGHVSILGNPFAGAVDHFINGPGSPLRNLRKFDPLVRLPLALGLGYLLESARLPRLRAALATAAGLAIGGLALPAYTGGVALAGSFGFPQYWVNAAHWLNQHAGHQTVLIEPGAPFSQYLWGSPLDNPLQPLLSADWADREVSTLGSPGNERLLDAIDQHIAAGDGSPGLTQLLARMGVRYVVVRNDLDRAVLEGAWPARVNGALLTSPGITRVYQSSPFAGTPAPDDAVSNLDPGYPAVVIYRVGGAEPVATVQPAGGTLRVYGGPESLLTLADEGLLGSRPVLLNSDSAGLPVAGSVVTDSLRRRVRNFGELRGSFSPTLTATQPARTYEATSDYTEPGWSRYLAVARYQGIAGVTASSSAADIGAVPSQWAAGLLPYAAVDGDPRTSWESGSWTGPAGQWIRLRFAAPLDPGPIRVAFASQPSIGPPVTQVTVRTAAGRVTDRIRGTGTAQVLAVPPGLTGWLQLTVTRLASPSPWPGAQVAIREIMVPGVRASRMIVAPAVHPAAATAVLAKAQPWQSGCMPTWLRWVCNPSLASPTEEQYGFAHAFTAGTARVTALRGSAVLTSSQLVSTYLGTNRAGVWIHGSSSYLDNPADQARAAFDGDPATAWTASAADARPILTIGWRHPRTVNRIVIQRPPGAVGLLQVLITGSDGQVRGANVRPSGLVRFPPMRTTRLTIRFTPLLSPLQISDVVIPGVPQLSVPRGTLRLRCGSGPALAVNGEPVPTRAWGTYGGLTAQRPLHFAACAGVRLRAGGNEVTEPARDAFSVQDVVVGPPPPPAADVPVRARIVTWTSASRVLRVTASTRSYLVVNENFNRGWQAVIGGTRLRALRLDGWKQAWLLPAGTTGTVNLTYLPDAIYRDSIVAGLSALAVIMTVAAGPWAWRRRRPRPVRVAPSGPPARTASPAGPALAALRPLAPLPPLPLPPGPVPPARRLRQAIVYVLARLAAAGGLALAGLWLGGYPGAVILPVATGGFLAARRPRPAWARLPAPWLAGALMLSAAATAAASGYLRGNGPLASWLSGGVPQILCLLIIGGLVASLIRPAGAEPLRSGQAARGVAGRPGGGWLLRGVRAKRNGRDQVSG